MEPTASAAARPRDWRNLARCRTSIISISWISFQSLSHSQKCSSSTQRLAKSSKAQDEHHQHQLDFLSALSLRSRSLGTHRSAAARPRDWRNLARRRTSIISISWISFQALSLSLSDLAVLEPTASAAARSRDWRKLARRRTSIISINWISIQAPSRSLGTHSKCSSSTQRLAKLSKAQDEHHQHQLDFLSSSLCKFSSSTQRLAKFGKAQDEHHQHQLDFLSSSLSLSPISQSWNPQQVQQLDPEIGEI